MNREEMRKEFPGIPQEIKDMIEYEVKRQLDMDKQKDFAGGRRAAPSMKKTVVIAAAAVLAIGTTAFAGSRIYEIYMEKEGNYGVKSIVSAGNTVEDTPMTAALNWLPEGMSKDFSNGKRQWYYESTPNMGGIWLQGYALKEDDVFKVLDTDIEESEEISLGEQKGIYLKKHTINDGGLWLDKTIYILYPEYNRVVCMSAGQDVTKEDAIRIAENITLESGEDELGNLFIDWKDAKEWMKPKEEMPEEEGERTEVAADQMKIRQIGEPILLNTFAYDESGELITDAELSACVTEVQALDDIGILDRQKINGNWEKALDENGRLKSHTIQYVKSGDGIHTVDEVVKTEELGRKLIYATVEYTNTGEKALSEILYMASICELEETDKGYRIYDRAAANPGQWDKLYLNLSPEGGTLEFAKGALEIGYVDIRIK